MNNENLKNYKLASPVPRPSLIKDSRYFKKNKASTTLKPSSVKLPKQSIMALDEI